jgi:hypothetical protein
VREEAKPGSEIMQFYAIPLILFSVASGIIGTVCTVPAGPFLLAIVVAQMLVTFLVAFTGVYISAHLVNELAPSFESKKDLDKSFALVVYSYTPSFLLSILVNMIPAISVVGLLSLYGIYLFWMGAGALLETPRDKRIGFVLISTMLLVGIHAILTLITGILMSWLFLAAGATHLFNP